MNYDYAAEPMYRVRDEIVPLLNEHWHEIAHYKDIPLEPDWKGYEHLEDVGKLRIYTVRDDGQRLVGYCVFIVTGHLHYSSSITAFQDILFLLPSHRGSLVGANLIAFAEADLRKDGVQLVTQHVKKAFDFGPMLVRMGYEAVETVYFKRLD